MTVALKKADGDIFIDPETGRGEEVSGPTKVDQELFSLYATAYDRARNWGSNLSVQYFSSYAASPPSLRAAIFQELVNANKRILAKQAADPYLDAERERITDFPLVDVMVDPASGSALFMATASVGDAKTLVGQQLFLSYKPESTRQVYPPPPSAALSFFGKGG